MPIPSIDELESMYVHDFYQKIKPDYIKKDESELPFWNITFDDKLDTIEQKIRKKNKNILDVGCGAGFFLQRAKKRGWNVTGIEPSIQAVEYAQSRGFNVIKTIFESYYKSTNDKFDSIHLNFVLEHTRDATNICESCFNLLKPKGVICVEVPNDFNMLQHIVLKKSKKPPYWIDREHVNYFSFDSLANLLKKTGFHPYYVESTFPLEMFMLFGLNYLNNEKIGQKIHSMRMNFEMTLSSTNHNSLKRKLYAYFAKQGLGRAIIMYAQKMP